MSPMVHDTVVLEGHLIDSDIMRRVFDRVVEGRGEFEVEEFRVGKRNDEPSYARIDIRAQDPGALEAIVEGLRYIGAVSADGTRAFFGTDSTDFPPLVRASKSPILATKP